MKDLILILALGFIVYLIVMLIIDAIKNMKEVIKDTVKYLKWKKHALAQLKRQKKLQRMADEEIARTEIKEDVWIIK